MIVFRITNEKIIKKEQSIMDIKSLILFRHHMIIYNIYIVWNTQLIKRNGRKSF